MSYKMYRTNLRSFVLGLETKIPLSQDKYVVPINFDNAATTPPFISVLEQINNFAPWYSSIHRGKGYKSKVSSDFYDNSRKIVLDFVKADSNINTVIYVKNTTEAINKLSNRLVDKSKKQVVLSTCMEHHSNDLPWREKYKVDYVDLDLDLDGRLSLKDLEQKLIKYKGSVKLVTISGASNVTGCINPIHKIAEIVHKYKAKILVDGAQLVPHVAVDVKPEDSPEHIDYLVFSGHKMYAPFGIGVLIGPKATFEKGAPDYTGGGTVDLVSLNSIIWEDPPEKEEAGTPNIMGVVALITAIKTLNHIGMDNIQKYEDSLTKYAISKLKDMENIELYGIKDCLDSRLGIIPFNIKGIFHDKLGTILSCEKGIAVRTGCFCAHPFVKKLLRISKEDAKTFMRMSKVERPGMVRISFALYNTYEEIDVFAELLSDISKNKEKYLEKYKNYL